MIQLLNTSEKNIIEPLQSKLFTEKKVSVSMLRLDLIHPVVSGNKIFKLYYFLEEAKKSLHKQIITFGGPYSNHLAAAAFACNHAGIKCMGFVHGEIPKALSHTLQFCLQNNMQIEFLTRDDYKKINSKEFIQQLTKRYGAHILIPEGGFSVKGMNGAGLIYNYFNQKNYTHICCPVGTATTFAGLIKANKETMILGFSVLKNLNDLEERLLFLNIDSKKYSIINDYNGGGYAKKNKELISFINSFYDTYTIPLDFVYTGKMMYGVYDLVKKNYFSEGSNVLCIHTGGLQGNNSLPKGTLNF